MKTYGYLQGLLLFMISGTNMSSNFIKLYMAGILTHWSSIESKNTGNKVRTKKL